MDSDERAKDAPDDNEVPEIRVTDKRRINLSQNGGRQDNATGETPNLKPTYVEELEARTKAAEKIVGEVQSRFDQLRSDLQREMDETRQRLTRSADERARREKGKFIAKLLPVLDNLRRARDAATAGGTLDTLIEGLDRTMNSFENILAAEGIERIPTVGQPFDPQLHEAVDTTETEPEMDGKVVAEYDRGYKFGDHLLRPARVQVGHAPEESSKVATPES